MKSINAMFVNAKEKSIYRRLCTGTGNKIAVGGSLLAVSISRMINIKSKSPSFQNFTFQLNEEC